MTFRLGWLREGGELASASFETETDARQAALQTRGIALMFQEPGRSGTLFRDGQELHGSQASEAFEEFSRQSRPQDDT
jgi:hypothetical protein